jgi:hypothetical protein
VAEAHFRSWLSEFLPKRFGVTAGFVISQGLPATKKSPAFDVIIYDQWASPVLWAESHPDLSLQGKLRAIPAEYVAAVIEVKAALNIPSAKEATEHLFDLSPLLGCEEPGSMYPYSLPSHFTCWIVFFELRKKDQRSFAVLDHLAKATTLRGFRGGLVIRGEGLELDMTGEIDPSKSTAESPSLPAAHNLLDGACFSQWHPLPCENLFGQVGISWSRAYFSTWPFHLLRSLNPPDRGVGPVPSWYGFPPIPRQAMGNELA